MAIGLPDAPNSVWLEAGDLDGSGRNDVVVSASPDVLVFARKATFALSGSYGDDRTIRGSGDIELCDWNGDGALDVVVEHQSAVTWLQGDKHGGLLPGVLIGKTPSESGGVTFSRLRVADLDGDGALDATLMTSNVGKLVTFYGDGAGGLKRVITVPSDSAGYYDDFALVDLNDDGLLDAIGVGGFVGPRVHFNQAGVLAPSGVPFGAQQSNFVHSVETGDVDGDGAPDVVISGGGNSPVDLIVLRHATGYQVERLATYEVPESIAIADVTGDGLADLVVTHGGWEKVGVYVQCGGRLQAERLFPVPYASHYQHSGIAVGHLDDDACPDVVLGDYNSGLVFLYGSGCLR